MSSATSVRPHHRAGRTGQSTARGLWGRLRTCVVAVGTGTLLISFAHSAPLAVASPPAVGPVLHWNAVLGDAAIAACLAPTANPLAEARLFAMTHIAIHDALNAIDPRFASYSADLFAPPRTSVDAAVAAASRTVMMSVFSELRDSVTTLRRQGCGTGRTGVRDWSGTDSCRCGPRGRPGDRTSCRRGHHREPSRGPGVR